MHGIVIYWAIGVAFTMLVLDKEAVEEIRGATGIDHLPNGDQLFFVALVITIVFASFFWPMIIINTIFRRNP